ARPGRGRLGEADPAGGGGVLVGPPTRQISQPAMGGASRLQTRAGKIAPKARLPQAQSVTVLDEPLESALQALLRPRPLFHEPGKRSPRAFASRAEIAQAESLLDEAEGTVALLSALGIPPAALGPNADEAELGPAAVKASAAIRSLVEGKPLSDEGPVSAQKLDEVLQNATAGSRSETVAQAAARIRTILIH